MAFNVTILSVDDENSQVQVLFEDTSALTSVEMGIGLPDEYLTETELLDWVSRAWPYTVFVIRGKAPVDRHTSVKGVLGVPKNITGRVMANDPTKLTIA